MDEMIPIKCNVPRGLKRQFMTMLRSRDVTLTAWMRRRMTEEIQQAEGRQELERLCEGEAYAETPARAS